MFFGRDINDEKIITPSVVITDVYINIDGDKCSTRTLIIPSRRQIRPRLVTTEGPLVTHLAPPHLRLLDRALFKHSPETTPSATGPTAETESTHRAVHPPDNIRPSIHTAHLSLTNNNQRKTVQLRGIGGQLWGRLITRGFHHHHPPLAPFTMTHGSTAFASVLKRRDRAARRHTSSDQVIVSLRRSAFPSRTLFAVAFPEWHAAGSETEWAVIPATNTRLWHLYWLFVLSEVTYMWVQRLIQVEVCDSWHYKQPEIEKSKVTDNTSENRQYMVKSWINCHGGIQVNYKEIFLKRFYSQRSFHLVK